MNTLAKMLVILVSIAVSGASAVAVEQDRKVDETDVTLLGVTREELVPCYEAMMRGEFHKALELADELVEKYPDDPNAINQRGRVRAMAGNYLGALEDANRVLELQPKYFGWWMSRGYLYLNFGYFELAASDFEKAVELNPKDVASLSRLGECRRWQGRDSEALELYLKADKLAPNSPDIQAFIGAALSHMGEFKKARTHGKNMLKVNPGWEGGHLLIGNYHRHIEEFEKAIEDYTRELQIHPKSIGALLGRADCYTRTGDKASAQDDVEAALVAQATYFTEKFWHGWSHYKLAAIFALRSTTHDENEKTKAADDLDRAFSLMTQAVNRGFRAFAYMKQDHDIDALREDTRWSELMKLVKEVE